MALVARDGGDVEVAAVAAAVVVVVVVVVVVSVCGCGCGGCGWWLRLWLWFWSLAFVGRCLIPDSYGHVPWIRAYHSYGICTLYVHSTYSLHYSLH